MTEYITGLQFLPWHILNVPFISFCCSVPLLISLMLEALILRKLKEMGIGVLAVRWQEQIGGKARGPGCESWDYMNARSHERNPGWSWASKSRLPTKYLNKKKNTASHVEWLPIWAPWTEATAKNRQRLTILIMYHLVLRNKNPLKLGWAKGHCNGKNQGQRIELERVNNWKVKKPETLSRHPIQDKIK